MGRGQCDVPAARISEAAEVLGASERLLSTVLQGIYQSHQATAAAVQINNLHLIRGMLGRPGAGVLQMNGQPTAQNTREGRANGDLPGFRNWQNDEHVADLARVWNVEPERIPHYAPPTHAMQMFRYAEQGSLGMLWISGTNPAVSLPELARVRSVLAQERLFTVVQDLFLTDKAVEPPGEARPDLDIFLDYAARMDFRDKGGAPLVHWHDPPSAFEAWKECSAGRPCDYTGLTYDLLRGPSGIQWPCNADAPEGTERLYTDGISWAGPEACEAYGKDLETGAADSAADYRARNPGGKAMIKPAAYLPAHEQPSEEHPFQLTTGRTLYHFDTRTKTGRAPS